MSVTAKASFYLMVSHADIRTHCVVNNLLPIIIIFFLKTGIYLVVNPEEYNVKRKITM